METGTRVRLYVGGLGPSVEDADLRHILGLMGRVLSVEMVRSKERDFAYVDFEPNSTAALAKVFSTYKGCKWKGGRLRIEKAQEHYLVRLQNEKESEMHQNAGRAIIPNILESQQNDKHVPQSLSEQNISTKDSCSNADKWEKLFQATAGLNVNCQPKRKIITTNVPMEMMQSHHADLGYTDANKAHVPEVENLETDTTKANTWIQKASWKSLVGENGNASFSLKSIVPQPLETHNEDAQHEFESAAVRIEEGSRVVHVVGPEHPDLSIYCKSATKRSKQSAKVLSETKDESTKDVTFELKNPVSEGNGTVLSSSDLPFKFMRSENAEQEWLSSRESIRTDYRAKHKAALRKIKKMQTVKF